MERNVWFITLMLASVAGYCDTVTFVSANEIFSAHVTGNIIVFAYDLIRGSDLNAWIKLITFPVFITSVITGGWLSEKSTHKYVLLFAESLLLIISGIAAVGLKMEGVFIQQWTMYFIVMLIVFAMGLQNTFGRIFSKETHAPTTIMTGNVTQASLDVGSLLRNKFQNPQSVSSFKKQLFATSEFLTGCLSGAIAGKLVSMAAIILPGIIITLFAISPKEIELKTPK